MGATKCPKPTGDDDWFKRIEPPRDRHARRAEADAARAYYDDLDHDGDDAIPRFLSRTEVAEYLGLAGVNSLSKIELPRPDVIVGKAKGWTKATIDEWRESRPGQGWWGPRD